MELQFFLKLTKSPQVLYTFLFSQNPPHSNILFPNLLKEGKVWNNVFHIVVLKQEQELKLNIKKLILVCNRNQLNSWCLVSITWMCKKASEKREALKWTWFCSLNIPELCLLVQGGFFSLSVCYVFMSIRSNQTGLKNFKNNKRKYFWK